MIARDRQSAQSSAPNGSAGCCGSTIEPQRRAALANRAHVNRRSAEFPDSTGTGFPTPAVVQAVSLGLPTRAPPIAPARRSHATGRWPNPPRIATEPTKSTARRPDASARVGGARPPRVRDRRRRSESAWPGASVGVSLGDSVRLGGVGDGCMLPDDGLALFLGLRGRR